MAKFNPIKIGFKKSKIDNNVYDLFDKKGKLIAWMALREERDRFSWYVYKVKYFENKMRINDFCYSGRMSSNAFSKQLLKNIL